MRKRDRLKPVRCVADDDQLRLLVENVAERAAHRGVIVDDEDSEGVRGHAAVVTYQCGADRCDGRGRRARDGLRVAAGRD